jgi:hypothetical protein
MTAMTRRFLATAMALVAAAAALSGCLGRDEHPGASERRPQTEARSAAPQRPATTALREVRLHPLNGSGVRGAARLLLRDGQLSVESFVSGAAPSRVHMQHIHVPPGSADGRCPTRALDANGDGLVSLKEGLGSYGPPVVSLEPFPELQVASWDYAATVTAPPPATLDRGVIVLHGMWVGDHYDELMPIACGAINPAVTREVTLDPVNDSTVAGTARLSLAGSHLYVWLSLGGGIAGRTHMQHIHLTKGRGRARCPTPDLDRNGDGLISLGEGLPAYGPPAVSLDPFPAPTGPRFEYSRTLRVPPGLALDRGVIVVHGMEVHGHYDDMLPVACGAITPALPQARSVQPGAGPSTSAYGAQPRTGRGSRPSGGY